MGPDNKLPVLAWWYSTSPILRGFKKNAEELAGASTLSCYLPSSLLQERRFTCKLRGLGDTDQHTPNKRVCTRMHM